LSNRALWLGRISAALVLVASAGLTEVHAHPMPHRGAHHAVAARKDAACSALSSEMSNLAGQMAAHHRPHDPRHPVPGTSSNCTCMGPCMDGTAVTSPDVAVSVDVPAESEDVGAAPSPTPLIHQDPTAYLSPLPNAPPLA